MPRPSPMKRIIMKTNDTTMNSTSTDPRSRLDVFTVSPRSDHYTMGPGARSRAQKAETPRFGQFGLRLDRPPQLAEGQAMLISSLAPLGILLHREGKLGLG